MLQIRSHEHDHDQMSTAHGANVSVQSSVRRLKYIRDCGDGGGGGQAERQCVISRVSDGMPARTDHTLRRMPSIGWRL